MPMYVYKTVGQLRRDDDAVPSTQALREGLLGWQVTDCTVTMTECGYISAPSTTRAAHFRKLTPAGPDGGAGPGGHGGLRADDPGRSRRSRPGATGAVLAAVARLGGSAGTPVLRAEISLRCGRYCPRPRAQDLQRQLPGLTSGEGVAETSFGGLPAGGRRTRPEQAQSRGAEG